MLKSFLAGTALAAGISGFAFAQQPAAPAAAPAAQTSTAGTAAEQMLASAVIGKTVYAGGDEEGESIGKVRDVVINPTGGTQALVVGVGGFLGIGEKDVAINFDRVTWSNRDGERILVASVTKTDLLAAPPFEMKPVMDPAVSTGDAAAPAQTGSAPLATPENTEVPLDAAGAGTAATRAAGQTPTVGTTPDMTDPDAALDTAGNGTVPPDDEMKPVDPAMLSTAKLIGTPVKQADDSQIGKVGDVILGENGALEAYVIDVGGFLGLGEKPVAMSARDIQVMADAKGAMTIYSPFTKEQLEKQKAYDEKAYKADPASILLTNPKP